MAAYIPGISQVSSTVFTGTTNIGGVETCSFTISIAATFSATFQLDTITNQVLKIPFVPIP